MSLFTLDKNFSLTPTRLTDAKALVTYLNDPEIYQNTLTIPFPYNATHAQDWLKMNDVHNRRETQHTWAIREGENLIGCIGFAPESNPANPFRAEIGYWLGKPHWGRGIMTLAVKRFTEETVKLGFVRLTAGVFDGNIASARVLEKAGYKCEGVSRKCYYKDGKFLDSLNYAFVA